MSNQRFTKAVESLVGLSAVFSVTLLTGCLGYVERPRADVRVRQSARVEIAEDYVYYPGYQMYYGSRSHQYYYQDGSAWVARPQPQGVSLNVLLAAPSVTMDFHDNPAAHHSQVIRTYPKNWQQSSGNQGHPAARKEDSRGDRKDDDNRR